MNLNYLPFLNNTVDTKEAKVAAWLLIIIASVNFLVNACYLPLFTNLNDFHNTYLAAKRLLRGQDMYQDYKRYYNLSAEEYQQNYKFYLYPPLLAQLVTPLTMFDYSNAKIIWHLFNQILAVVTFFVCLRSIFKEMTFLQFGCAWFLYFQWYPLTNNAQFGNYDVVILLLIAVAFLAYQEKWEFSAGVSLGIGVALKVFPAFLVVYFLWKRRWKVVVGAGLTVALSVVIVAPFLSPAEQLNYMKMASYLPAAMASPVNQSFEGFWRRLLTEDPIFTSGIINSPTLSKIAVLLSRLAVVGVLFGLGFRNQEPDSRREKLGLALALTTQVLVSTFSDVHHFVVLIWCYLYLLALAWERELQRSQSITAMVSFGILATWIPIYYFRIVNQGLYLWLTQGWAVLLLSAHFYAICILWVVIALRWKREIWSE